MKKPFSSFAALREYEVPDSIKNHKRRPDPNCYTCKGTGEYEEQSYHNGDYYTADCDCVTGQFNVSQAFYRIMYDAEDLYNRLIEEGISEEDAKLVIPLAGIIHKKKEIPTTLFG